MNRRNFFGTLVKGVGVFTILPPAETYARIWKATREPIWIYEMLQNSRLELVTPSLNLEALFQHLYALKEKRRQMSWSDTIDIWCSKEDLPLFEKLRA